MSTSEAAKNRPSSSSSAARAVPTNLPERKMEILQTSRTTATAATTASSLSLSNAGGLKLGTVSEVSVSSSVGWSGDYCKKMMALNWDYTCGPLRVVQVGPHNYHWARLHAPGHAVLPRADGTLQHFRETHKHITDADLIRQVLQSGVAKPRRDPKEKLLSPVKFSIKDEDIDNLRSTLSKKSIPLPPARPPQTVFNRRQEFDDASSIFSVTDVAGSTVSRRSASTTVASKSDSKQFLRELSGTRAKHIALSQQNQSPVEETQSNVGSTITASSKQQQQQQQQQVRPSSRQEAQKALSAARAERESVTSELQKAKEKLAQIERIVEEHESSKRSSSSRRESATVASKQPLSGGGGPPALNQRELTNELSLTRKALTPFC